MRTTVMLLLMLLSYQACAINKCTDTTGRVTYQAEPCVSGAQEVLRTIAPTKKEIPLEDNPYFRSITGVSWKDRIKYMATFVAAGRWKEDILASRVAIGMPKELALAIKGMPDSINRTTTEHSVREQWVYHYRMGNYNLGTLYIYIRNNAVEAVQD